MLDSGSAWQGILDVIHDGGAIYNKVHTVPSWTPDFIPKYNEIIHLKLPVVFCCSGSSLTNLIRGPIIPFCSNLNIKPSSQTLSNALEISRNTEILKKDLKLSKDVWISLARIIKVS